MHRGLKFATLMLARTFCGGAGRLASAATSAQLRLFSESRLRPIRFHPKDVVRRTMPFEGIIADNAQGPHP